MLLFLQFGVLQLLVVGDGGLEQKALFRAS